MQVLRTPDTSFENLPEFDFEPHYSVIHDKENGDLRIHYLDEGPREAPVIICLHGQATWSYLYRKMIPIFVEAGYRVIAPDFVGFGRSDKLPDEAQYTYQKNVDWLASFLTGLDIKDATGFLFDWGGMFGLRVALDHPEIFSRLVLLNTTLPQGNKLTSAIWVFGWRRYVYRKPEFPIGSMLDGMTETDIPSQVVAAYDAPYPDESYKKGPWKMPLMIPATPLNPVSAPNTEAWKKLEQWEKPVITLFSETLAKRGLKPDDFQKRIPGARGQNHETIPGAGFFIVEDQSELLAEKTLAFIKKDES